MASPNDIVKVYNPDDEDFSFKYGGVDYVVPEGQTGSMQRYLAEHYRKHLTDKILNKGGRWTNDADARKELEDQIIVATEEDYSVPDKKTHGELTKEKFDELNPPTELSQEDESDKPVVFDGSGQDYSGVPWLELRSLALKRGHRVFGKKRDAIESMLEQEDAIKEAERRH